MGEREFRLPDGTVTTDAETMVGAWEAFYGPLEKALGVRVTGFDPGISLVDRVSFGTAQIPVWLARRIRDALSTVAPVQGRLGKDGGTPGAIGGGPTV